MNDDITKGGPAGPPSEYADTVSDGSHDDRRYAQLITESFPPVPPSPDVWSRIEAQINEETPQTSEADTSVGAHAVSARWGAPRLAPLMAIAALFLLVAAGSFVLSQRSATDVVVAGGEDLVRSLTDTSSGEVALRVVTADDGSTVAINDGLPVLPEDQTYQLWSVIGDEVVSVGLLGSNPAEVTLRVEGSPSVLALSVEPAGGVAVSQVEPVAVWAAG